MPKIACGLDNLDWKLISAIINKTFAESQIDLTIYELHNEQNTALVAPPINARVARRNTNKPNYYK